MATTFLLVRHASCERMHDVLPGRTTPAPLTPAGRAEAALLAASLAFRNVAGVLSSPRRRAQQTAMMIAAQHDLPVTTDDALDEFDFGAWEGRTFAELAADPAWQRWNSHRSQALTPGGETMASVRERLFRKLEHLRGDSPQCYVLVTHAEVIRTAVLALLDLSPDAYARFDIGPARVTTIVAGPGARLALAGINEPLLREAVA